MNEESATNPETSAILAQAGQKNLLDLNTANGLFSQYISSHGAVEATTVTNRRLRSNKADVEQMRSAGLLQENQTFIGVRLINQNINQALPPLLSYLKQSPRMATFVPGDNSYLDQEFTRVLQYPGWEIPYIEVLDGAELNGIGYMMVKADNTKLGGVSMETIPFNEIVYDRRLKSLQDSPAVLIKHVITAVSFYHWDSFENFDKNSDAYKAIAKRLLSEEVNVIGDDLVIYETFVKVNGFVYRGWYYKDSRQWLKQPLPFSNGIEESVPEINIDPMAMTSEPTYVNKPVHLTYYPIAVKRSEIKENRKHDEAEGRAVEDYHKQEAATTLMTAAVNGCTQAANTMWSPDGANLDGVAPAQLQYKIKNNAIWKTPMKAFTAPWPDPMIFKGIEAITQQNAMENNQVAWAVNNRKDSRKTATEIEAAQQQQGMLTGTAALVFSIFLRDVLTMTWPIVQSEAKKGSIKFLIEVSDPAEKEAILSKQYEVKPAGDIDFVEKQQRITNIQQDLPMFQGTPIGQEMMKEYVRLRYPEKYDQWSKILSQGNDSQLIQGLGQALQAVVTDEATGQLKPEFAAEAQSFQQLQQAVEQRLAQQPNATQQG
jgi:hypothetical protein